MHTGVVRCAIPKRGMVVRVAFDGGWGGISGTQFGQIQGNRDKLPLQARDLRFISGRGRV